MLTRFPGFDGVSHKLGQLGRTCNRAAFLSARNNRLCNSASKPFFTVVTYHLRYLVKLGTGQPLRHALATRRIHTDIERSFQPETETARRVVDLRRTDSQVEQYTGHAGRGQFAQLCKALVPNGKTWITDGGGFDHGIGIFIEGDQTPLCWQPGENQATVTSSTKGGIHIGRRARLSLLIVEKRVDCLIQQNGS